MRWVISFLTVTCTTDVMCLDVGRPGEVVSVKESQARYLLLTKRAEYPSQDNLTKAGTAVVADAETYSSRYVGYVSADYLKSILV